MPILRKPRAASIKATRTPLNDDIINNGSPLIYTSNRTTTTTSSTSSTRNKRTPSPNSIREAIKRPVLVAPPSPPHVVRPVRVKKQTPTPPSEQSTTPTTTGLNEQQEQLVATAVITGKFQVCCFCSRQIKANFKRYCFSSHGGENGHGDNDEFVGGRRNALGERQVKSSKFVCPDCYKENQQRLKNKPVMRSPPAKKREGDTQTDPTDMDAATQTKEEEEEEEEHNMIPEEEEGDSSTDEEEESEEEEEEKPVAKSLKPSETEEISRKCIRHVQTILAAAVVSRGVNGPVSQVTLNSYLQSVCDKFGWGIHRTRGVVVKRKKQRRLITNALIASRSASTTTTTTLAANSPNVTVPMLAALNNTTTFLPFRREPGGCVAWRLDRELSSPQLSVMPSPVITRPTEETIVITMTKTNPASNTSPLVTPSQPTSILNTAATEPPISPAPPDISPFQDSPSNDDSVSRTTSLSMRRTHKSQ